jgi:AraC-like DNA-binding protein
MAPPRVLNSFAAVPGHRWSFAWVRYDEPHTVHPLVGASSPMRLRTDAGDLRRVIEGLRAEWTGAQDPRLLHHWISLLHGHACRLARPQPGDERLWSLWDQVGRELGSHWTLELLAARCHMSKENLRRVCLRELGRSPMQQLTSMRMQNAQELLESTRDKLEVVAAAVGYDSALVFSRAFKRWVGCNPSDYRGRGSGRPSGR